MEDLLDLMESRRSIRDYTDEDVTDEQVQTMLKAAMAAPSAQDLCPWHFVVVRKRKKLDKLAEIHKYASMLKKAPVGIVVCGDRKESKRHWVEDAGAATQNLLLAATALGLGSAWI
jgi:nitroreductase